MGWEERKSNSCRREMRLIKNIVEKSGKARIRNKE